MKAPAFQFYADDFLAGTADMTNEEVGAYIRLLCHQWSKGCIPGDMDRVSRMAGAMPVPSLGYILSKFQRGEDGNFRNARMEAERKKQDEYRLKQAEKGKVGADKRWNHGTGHAPAIADAIAPAMPVPQPKDGSPSPSPSPSPVSSLQSPPPKVTRVPKLHVGGAGDVRSEKASPLSEEEWIQSLIQNSAYDGIDIRREMGKCSTWCAVRGIKTVTRRRFVNWLNKADKPINGHHTTPRLPGADPDWGQPKE